MPTAVFEAGEPDADLRNPPGGDLKAVQPRGNRIVFFARDELRRFLLNELRKAGAPMSRDLAEKIITADGKDARDRRLRNDMVSGWVRA